MAAVPPGLRRRPLVFVADLERPLLDEADRHHLERVLRLRPGTEVTIADGSGRWRVAALAAEPEPLGPVTPAEPSPGDGGPVVAFAPTKGDRPEWVVQKLTELGVGRIVAVEADRSVVRWDPGRAARQVQRWHRVAREAAMQSRRLRLPTIDGVVPAVQVLCQPQVVAAEPGGRPLGAGDAGVAVGPEGGWTPEELATAGQHVALPGGVLRAETAAVVAGALLVGLRQGLVRPVGEAPPVDGGRAGV